MLLYGHFIAGDEIIDECMAVYMAAPKTYTREDVAEFHLHGGSMSARRVLDALYAYGIRPADPGEFTRRAFLNGRIDLSRAEAVMSLINADSVSAARAAVRQLEGGVSGFIRSFQEKLTAILAGIAAAIDYPEEISFEEAAGDAAPALRSLASELSGACDERAARIREHGLNAVLCGLPNVGKSSLLNRLAREDRAIVTAIPGTTRDIVTAEISLNGVKICLSDTAGLRENTDTIETIGVERARGAISGADVVLIVLDASRPLLPEEETLLRETEGAPRVIVYNKCDLTVFTAPEGTLAVSAVTGEGIDELEKRIFSFVPLSDAGKLTMDRHMALARQASASLLNAADACENGTLDAAAVEAQEALETLGAITGDHVSEQMLDDIFSRFCVGK